MDIPDREYFNEKVDASSDWEVSFYRSLSKVDGLLVLGGGPSTLIAGQIALSLDLPIVAIAFFGGTALKIWQQHLSAKPAFIDNSDVQVMARWNNNSADQCIQSLANQYIRRQSKAATEEKELQAIKEKSLRWDEHLLQKGEDKARTVLAATALGIFVIFLILGLITNPRPWLYSLVTILGLCVAGRMGATVRMLTPTAGVTRKWVAPVLGTTVGLVFSLLYALPQVIQNAGFLIPTNDPITPATRVQYY